VKIVYAGTPGALASESIAGFISPASVHLAPETATLLLISTVFEDLA
jgi:hypothetical protein